MEEKIKTPKELARFAGLLYLVVVALSVYGHIYVPLQIYVKDDLVATTNNILAKEFLFRSCVIAGLLESMVLMFLGLVLFRLPGEVNRQLARAMVVLTSIQVPLAFVIAIFKFAVLMLLKDDQSVSISSTSVPGLAHSFLKLARYGMLISGLMGGLWLVPFGLLAFRSRFIPRVLGVLLISAGLVYILESLVTILLSGYNGQAQMLVFIFFLAEIIMMFWLLIKGVNDHVSIEVVSETKRKISTPATKLGTYIE